MTTKPTKPRVYKSGAEKRRAARDRKIAELLAELDKLGWQGRRASATAGEDGEGGAVPEWVTQFDEAGDPDLDNPEVDLGYQRRLLQIVSRQSATTYNPPPEQVAHWKRIRDNAAVVGMTHPRSALEVEVKRLKAQITTHQSRGVAEVVRGSTIAAPATARGQRGARGPRPLPRSVPGPGPGEDEGDPPPRRG